jgi:hypothetical protein
MHPTSFLLYIYSSILACVNIHFISLYFTGGAVFETRDFEGCSQLEFTAQLEGGVGDTAWQHAQLFRQKIADDDYPLDITVTLKQQL